MLYFIPKNFLFQATSLLSSMSHSLQISLLQGRLFPPLLLRPPTRWVKEGLGEIMFYFINLMNFTNLTNFTNFQLNNFLTPANQSSNLN